MVHCTLGANQNLEVSVLVLRETVELVKTEQEALEALGGNEKLVACGIYHESGFGEPQHYMVGAVRNLEVSVLVLRDTVLRVKTENTAWEASAANEKLAVCGVADGCSVEVEWVVGYSVLAVKRRDWCSEPIGMEAVVVLPLALEKHRNEEG